MVVVDGRMCYEWRGFLFRAKDSALEAKPVGSGTWSGFDPDAPPGGCPIPDDELLHRLPDLLEFWDKSV